MNPWDLSCRSTTSLGSSTFNHSLSSSPSSSRSNSLTTNDVVDTATAFRLQIVSDNSINNKASLSITSHKFAEIDPSTPNNPQQQSQKHQLHHQQQQQHIELTTVNPLQLDKKARKKDQNRRAAYNYRRKKMEEKNRIREEEMRLVYSRVCLIGYAEELEGSIMYILNTETRKISDKFGNTICFLCPICLQSCDNILNLRSHLNIIHYNDNNIDINNNNSDKCIVTN